MKVLIFLAVLTSLVFADQITAQDTAKVEVVKFNWSMYDRRKIINESALFDGQASNRPGRSNRMIEKTIEERSQDLSRIENAARRSALPPPGNIFLYQLKVKNLDEKTIKSFIWEYQPVRESVPQNPSSRRFLCIQKIKTGDSKTLRIISHLPPVNVVEASVSNGESKKDFVVDVLINRVEYADGTVWKRVDWDDSKYALDSPKIAEKLRFNDCTAL